MYLKIKRSQKPTMMGAAIFGLDFQAEVSLDERILIDKFKLGKDILYSSEAFQKKVMSALSAGAMGDALSLAKCIAAGAGHASSTSRSPSTI